MRTLKTVHILISYSVNTDVLTEGGFVLNSASNPCEIWIRGVKFGLYLEKHLWVVNST